LNIIIIIHNQVDSGPYRKVLEMCNALVKRNYNITLLCTSKTNRLFIKKRYFDNLTIIESPDILSGKLRQGLDLWNTLIRIFFLLNKKYDIVNGIDCRPVVIFPSLFLKYIKRIPLVLNWWDLFSKKSSALERSGKLYAKTFGIIEEYFDRRFRKFADKSITATKTLYHELLNLDYLSENISIIKLGTDKYLAYPQNKLELRKEMNLPTEEKILCYVGSIFPNDKILFIESLVCLQNYISIMPLTIVIGNINFEANLEKDLNIRKIGYVEENLLVHKLIAASDFGLIPFCTNLANKARWPSKVSDYLINGIPIICTPVSDFPEIFKTFDIGYITNSDSKNDFSEKMLEALNATDFEYDKKSQRAYSFADENLLWDKVSLNINKAYESLL
jgi:glycosyltransferase involved in cell wall biosynthesis